MGDSIFSYWLNLILTVRHVSVEMVHVLGRQNVENIYIVSDPLTNILGTRQPEFPSLTTWQPGSIICPQYSTLYSM